MHIIKFPKANIRSNVGFVITAGEQEVHKEQAAFQRRCGWQQHNLISLYIFRG